MMSNVTEKTFSAFTKDQGANYAQNRPKYHPDLFKVIVDRHTSTGGHLNTILDVGCGPGIAVRALAPQFEYAIGLDPSEGMLTTARTLGGASSSSEPIRFEVSSAEELGSGLSPPIADFSVDLITAAAAAHWFDMSRFWPAAARVLKPGGSVALWSTGGVQVHSSVPNYEAIQASLDDIDERCLVPFYEPGNLLTRSLYEDLPLPWTVSPPVEAFDEETFLRKEWSPGEEGFYAEGYATMDLDTMERALGTGSPVQRWRDAHPKDVGTERDVVRMMRREIERLMREAGVEEGKEVVKGSFKGVLLVVKKK